MFNFFRKKQEEISRTTPGFEETERKTPKTGVILLVIMFVAGIFFGWRALDDLAKIPSKPAPLSYCGRDYQPLSAVPYSYYSGHSGFYEDYSYQQKPLSSEPYYNYYRDSQKCVFNQTEKERNIPALMTERFPLEERWKSSSGDLNSVNNSLYDVRSQVERATGEYGTGLEEKQTGIPQPIFPIVPAGESILLLRQRESELLNQQSVLTAERQRIEGEIRKVDDKLKEAYKPVFQAQNRAQRWYEFKVFLLQFIFTLPFFLFAFWGYLRLHRKSSPYTLIFTAMVGVTSILFLRVILFWFWGLFLQRVFEILIEWFGRFGFFRVILFYGGMILSFVVFGGAVWWLQKKIFDPRRVIIRRFRAKQCPHCQTNLDLTAYYCPNCGNQIKAKCEKCGQARFVGLPSCPYCGTKREA